MSIADRLTTAVFGFITMFLAATCFILPICLLFDWDTVAGLRVSIVLSLATGVMGLFQD